MTTPSAANPPLCRDAKRVLGAALFFALGFLGISELVKVLYVLRLGFTPERIGTMMAIGATGYAATSIPAGLLGARFGQRPMMLLGGVLMVCGLALMPASSLVSPELAMTLPLIAQVCITVGWALLNVNLVPLLTAVTTTSSRNRAFSLNAALRGAGILVGMLFGGMLPSLFASITGHGLDRPEPYAWALVTAVALAAVGFLPLLRPLSAEIDDANSASADEESADAAKAIPWVAVGLLLLHGFVGNSGWATCQAFFAAYADTELLLTASQLGMLSALGQGIAVAMTFLVPRLAKRHGSVWILMITQLGQALSLALIYALPHWSAAGLGRWGILGLSAMWLPAIQLVQMDLFPARWRAIGYGIVSASFAGSFATASLVGGRLATRWGSYQPIFGIGAVLCGLAAVVAAGLMRKMRTTH